MLESDRENAFFEEATFLFTQKKCCLSELGMSIVYEIRNDKYVINLLLSIITKVLDTNLPRRKGHKFWGLFIILLLVLDNSVFLPYFRDVVTASYIIINF